MSSRRKTPDVLSEVLGAGADPLSDQAPAPTARKPLPTVGAPRTASKSAPKKTGATKSSAKNAMWVYREVTLRDYRGWRVRYVDGVEVEDWKDGPIFRDELARLGREGWEMTGIVSSGRNERQVYFKQSAS
jgi:hypothetical protein